jgi:signal transduction histidine kinase
VKAARIFTPDGQIFASYGSLDGTATVLGAPSTTPSLDREHHDYRAGYLELTRQIGEPQRPLGTLFLRADLAALNERLTHFAAITGIVLALSLLAALGVSWFLQREVSAPVLDLVNTAQRVALGKDYAARATQRSGDELGVLSAAFNDMLEQIQHRDQQLRAANRDLKQRGEELALKNEDVEAFVYIVSHDLRAPLVNLQGFSRELGLSCETLGRTLAEAPLPAATRDQVHEIVQLEIPSSLRFISASTAKFERLINALLELSRSGRRELRLERVDVEALLAGTLDSLRLSVEQSGAEVVVGSLPAAYADPTALGQVFSNLLTNALRYLQPGRPGRIEVSGQRDGASSGYSVTDNGVGISATAQRKLFQVFQRFRPDLADGEGMGLATVKRIVERHGGRIWVESTEGVGTTFRFTLPDTPTVAGAPS